MPKLFNFDVTIKVRRTITASTYEEMFDKLADEYGSDFEVTDCDTEEFDPNEDDYCG